MSSVHGLRTRLIVKVNFTYEPARLAFNRVTGTGIATPAHYVIKFHPRPNLLGIMGVEGAQRVMRLRREVSDRLPEFIEPEG